MKNLVLIDRPLNKNSGGGAGYLFKLDSALNESQSTLSAVYAPKMEVRYKSLKRNLLNRFKVIKFLMKLLIGGRLIMKLFFFEQMQPSKELRKRILKKDFNSIHLHHVVEFISVYNFVKKNKIECKLILTCHDPGPTSNEIYSYFSQYSKLMASFLRSRMRVVEKHAFNKADFLIFPCPESVDYFCDLIGSISSVDSKIDYVPTGTLPYKPSTTPEQYLSSRELPIDFVFFSFAGRHNKVKGYDVLKSAAIDLSAKLSNIGFLIAGSESPMKGLDLKYWHEEGWTNDPASLVNSSDVFVAPNRKGFFDLVILEAMSLGKVILATNTGGAVSIAKSSDGIFLVEPDNVKELVSMMLYLTNLGKAKLKELGQHNKVAFDKYFTTTAFAEKYDEVVMRFLNGDN